MTYDCIFFCSLVWLQISSHLIIKTSLCEHVYVCVCVCVCVCVWWWHRYLTSQMGKLSLRGIKQLIQRQNPPLLAKVSFRLHFPSPHLEHVCLMGPGHQRLLSVIHFSLWLNFAWFSLETPTEVSGLRQILWTLWAVNKVTEGQAQCKFCRLSDLKGKQPGKNQSSGHRGTFRGCFICTGIP